MTTTSLAEAHPQSSRYIERLKFISEELEEVTANDVVNALVGVTWALDLSVNGRDEDHERNIHAGLATAARLLAEQLQSRLECDDKPRRREGSR